MKWPAALLPRRGSKLARDAKDNEHAISQTKHRDAVVSIDISKNSFHVVGLDHRGAIVLHCTEIW